MNNSPSVHPRRCLFSSAAAAVLAVCTIALLGGSAEASPIDYIFTGTGTGTLDGTAFANSFTVTFVADTSTIGSGGGEFTNAGTATFAAGALSATLTGTLDEVIDNTAAPGFIGFAQLPSVSDESTTNSAFETYDLSTALSLTTGTPSVAPATFDTSVGDLDFATITALNFEAVIPTSVPEPASLAIFGTALAGLAFLRRRKLKAASAD